MELKQVIQNRKSVRHFKNKEVPDLTEIINLAKRAPSAGAIRGYRVMLTSEKLVNIDAPIYLVICANPETYVKRYGNRGRELYSVQDATIFGAYLQLLLVDEGLSSVWIGAFRENKIKRILNINLRPIAIIAVGYEL